jgi:hypothetical protein
VDWGTAFFRGLDASLDGALQRAHAYEARRGRPVRPDDGSLAGGEALLRSFVAEHRRRWVPPREYVLSHIDGIQAVVDRDTGDTGDGTRWVLRGHVDLEDFAFIDARMALAGYELEYEGQERRRRVPPEFWAGYRRHKQVDPTYEATRELFWFSTLLAWSRLPYSAQWERWYRDTAEREKDVQRYARAIVGLATHTR